MNLLKFVDGQGIVSYLDTEMEAIVRSNRMVTGIVIGTTARKKLSDRCQVIMGMHQNNDELVNRYRGALLIEDADSPDRVEIIVGKVPPVPPTDMFGLPTNG